MRFRDLDSPGASAALDRWITGNYGDDAERDEDEPERCVGRANGCSCQGCEEWAEREFERQQEED